ncbi:MAG TPA: amino acid adenylation domain-containing protein, partial [Polyangiaceae bacterium]|nr:amino acid adenylation domain-containing protein [Polyangiaceae bacterium]
MPVFTRQDLVSESARQYPDRAALAFRGATLTYAELCSQMWGWAHQLREVGVAKRDRVGVLMNRSFESYVAILGALQAGAAYVPFDVTAPRDRLVAVLRDCDIRYLVVDRQNAPKLAEILADYPELRCIIAPEPVAGVRTVLASDIAPSSRPPDVRTVESDLALIFYTSGSTGKPKGVAHSHRSMLSNVEWALQEFRFTHRDRFSNVTSHHFDLCWLEMYASLACGGCIVIAPESSVRFPLELAALTAEQRVSVWCSVPSVLIGLLERGQLERHDWSHLERVLFAGERFPVKHLHHLMGKLPNAQFCNMYGTTETHIAAFYPVLQAPAEDAAPLPIGKPCRHVNLLVVGADGSPVEPGQTGQLVIRGPSQMEGYWGMPERTAQVVRGVREAADYAPDYYFTGDLVRVNEHGDIEVIGRADRRVKVRGYLVDLDEVEKVLLRHESVKEAGVFVVGEEGVDARLEAAVVPKPGAEASPAELRYHAARTLPVYAVPESVYVVPEFPRTGSGKLDRVSLRNMQPELSQEPASAGSLVEKTEADPRAEVKGYIANELALNSALVLDDQTDMIESGILDS